MRTVSGPDLSARSEPGCQTFSALFDRGRNHPDFAQLYDVLDDVDPETPYSSGSHHGYLADVIHVEILPKRLDVAEGTHRVYCLN